MNGSDNYQNFCNDSSNWAQEGMGIPEFSQFLCKPKDEQERIEKELIGTTCEVSIHKEIKKI